MTSPAVITGVVIGAGTDGFINTRKERKLRKDMTKPNECPVDIEKVAQAFRKMGFSEKRIQRICDKLKEIAEKGGEE